MEKHFNHSGKFRKNQTVPQSCQQLSKNQKSFICSTIAIFGLMLLLVVIKLGCSHSKVDELHGSKILNFDSFKHYIDKFNRYDDEYEYNGERVINYISNESVCPWLKENIPFFECSDKEIEEIYYFRWWTYRKHIKKTPDGFVITEFLPKVGWSRKYNTISCAAGHHFYEGRWLHNTKYLDDYSIFWFRKGGSPRQYSFWAADALYARYLVNPNKELITSLLPDLVKNYMKWENSKLDSNGLFWQGDGYDGMELSIGGGGYRPTINSYMYGDASAIAKIAQIAGQSELSSEYKEKAAYIKALVQSELWDDKAKFFKTLPRDGTQLVDVREAIGFVPWYFNLPDQGYEAAWKELIDIEGFYAPFGPTTAERRHPRFMFEHEHDCRCNGRSMPYATTQTLTGLDNLLNNYKQEYIEKEDYFKMLKIYAKSHHLKLHDGEVVPWIGENQHPDTGEWIVRNILYERNQKDKDRGKDYNHSAYCDIIIKGLAGLRPRNDDTVEVNPLVPEGTLEYFCLDNVLYHGHLITILYDKTGKKYKKGQGLRVFADGNEIAYSEKICRLTAKLPSSEVINVLR